MTKHIYPYILKSEYWCKCCKEFPPDFYIGEKEKEINVAYLFLFSRFMKIREEWDKPIPISSGYRCPIYNKAIGGVPLSIHIFGLALDLDCKDKEEVNKLSAVIEDACSDVRMGVYKDGRSFIHFDVGYIITPRARKEWRKGARWHG